LSILIVVGITITRDRPLSAQSTTDFRAEITNLRTRVSQLEREVRRLSQASNRTTQSAAERTESQSTVTNPPLVNGQSIGRSDPMFERLANLVIELKQEVRELEQRVVEIERQLAQR
jgi:polyhydroxyalkanoate synthesis regulator phasin